MSLPVRMLLLDDDLLVRNSIRWLLNLAPDLHLVGETTNIAELPGLCAKTNPHLLLIGGG